jgi:hypothetical protein
MAHYRSCRPGFVSGQALIGITAGIMIMTSVLIAGLAYVRLLTTRMEDVATWSDEARMLAACACVSCPRITLSADGMVMLADQPGHHWAIGGAREKMVFASSVHAKVPVLYIQTPWGCYAIADLDGNY